MTDVSSVKAHADHQPASVAPYGGPPPAFTNGLSVVDGVDDDESSTIKCVCGYSHDDGNTVLCEKCDTWQHIACYYTSAGEIPEVHECNDCHPRDHLDKKAAAEKQRLRHSVLTGTVDRKSRTKTTAKSSKKRAKDPLGSVQPNGWAVHSNNDHHYSTERKSGSPRDQPPPAKRPKTSHRSSGSVNIVSQAPALAPASRKRGASVMLNGHSPVKSPVNPEGPIEEFSLEFMNLYRQPEPPSTDSNSYTDLRVANDIASWLNDRDALAEATGGMSPGEIFQRIEQPIEDMEASLAPVLTKQTGEDPSIEAHGLHPQWHFLTVESPVAADGFIGELKGRIGRKQDYYSDPSNRWLLLRHPEPFVFFPPHLPIYIDTRHEGTILRYARRSCNPNMVMKILTQGPESDYHFCFLAKRDIELGEELTVGWEIDSVVRQQLTKAVHNGDIKKEGFKKIQPWVACVLANFGGCACDNSAGYECLLERARRTATTYAEPIQPLKTKGKKAKKAQVSPLSTGHATNSRAGSEAFPRDAHEDDNMDSRSTSGSHKSSSRDITPATHFSLDDGNGKMSERERRKLQQQERLFEQLEYDEQHKGKRGKRNSAGSTLNTPSLTSSVRRSSRPPLFEANQTVQKQIGHTEPSPSARHLREHSNGVARKSSGSSTRTNGRAAPKPKPVYVDSSTQTEDDKTAADAPSPKVKVMMPPLSFKRKLLQQAQQDKIQRERMRSAAVKLEMNSPALKDVISSNPSPMEPAASLEEPTAMDISTDITAIESNETKHGEDEAPASAEDVEMKDVEEMKTPKEELVAGNPELSPKTSHPPIQLPPPPWGSSAVMEDNTPLVASPSERAVENPLEASAKSDHIIPPLSTGTLATTPSSGPPLSPFSPAVTSAVTPGPARKKLSLSDYTSRRAKLAQQTSNTSATPPLVPSQSASSPTLSNASLPNNASPPTKSVEPVLPPVAEETKPIVTTTTSTMTTSTSTTT